MNLQWIDGTFSCCRLDPQSPIPSIDNPPCFITRTCEEISIICHDVDAPPDARTEDHYIMFRVAGPLDFTLAGVLADIASALASADIPILAVSTFDTDYILVKKDQRQRAVTALANAGHQFTAM